METLILAYIFVYFFTLHSLLGRVQQLNIRRNMTSALQHRSFTTKQKLSGEAGGRAREKYIAIYWAVVLDQYY